MVVHFVHFLLRPNLFTRCSPFLTAPLPGKRIIAAGDCCCLNYYCLGVVQDTAVHLRAKNTCTAWSRNRRTKKSRGWLTLCLVKEQNRLVSVHGNAALEIFGDYHRLEQVICNLLSNAFNYSDAGLPVQVSFELLNEKRVRVSIKDCGIGIPENKLPLVFDRFFRVEETSINYSGIWLGLFICAEIVKMHRGIIGVYSCVKTGATFWFELPLEG